MCISAGPLHEPVGEKGAENGYVCVCVCASKRVTAFLDFLALHNSAIHCTMAPLDKAGSTAASSRAPHRSRSATVSMSSRAYVTGIS